MRFRLLARACVGVAALAAAPGLAAQPSTASLKGVDRVADASLPVGSSLAAPAPNVNGFAPWFSAEVDQVVEAAIARGAAPGVAVVVGHAGQIVLSKGFGHLDRSKNAPAVTDETLWDLASVTKVAATSVAAMLLVQDGALDLDAPIHTYLADWPSTGPRAQITARQLLHHNSGLRAGAIAIGKGDRAQVAARLAKLPLAATPGTKEIYSDLDMVLLGAVIEAAAGEPLDQLLARRVYGPLGMRETTFRPKAAGIAPERIAPTEKLGPTALRGIVHDPIARDMGGISGNAGLFSSARDLATLASSLLWEAPERLVCRDVVDQFTRPVWGDRYALGWENATPDTYWGELFSRQAYGHTGYTGTSLWIDPQLDVFVVLLTNRVNPSALNQRHIALRRELHETVVRALADAPSDGGRPASQRDGCFADRIAEGFRNLPPIRWPR